MKPSKDPQRNKRTRRHEPAIHPVLGGRHFQAMCGCSWQSDTMDTYAEAWLAGAIHKKNAPRTSGKTRLPRWAEARRGDA